MIDALKDLFEQAGYDMGTPSVAAAIEKIYTLAEKNRLEFEVTGSFQDLLHLINEWPSKWAAACAITKQADRLSAQTKLQEEFKQAWTTLSEQLFFFLARYYDEDDERRTELETLKELIQNVKETLATAVSAKQGVDEALKKIKEHGGHDDDHHGGGHGGGGHGHHAHVPDKITASMVGGFAFGAFVIGILVSWFFMHRDNVVLAEQYRSIVVTEDALRKQSKADAKEYQSQLGDQAEALMKISRGLGVTWFKDEPPGKFANRAVEAYRKIEPTIMSDFGLDFVSPTDGHRALVACPIRKRFALVGQFEVRDPSWAYFEIHCGVSEDDDL